MLSKLVQNIAKLSICQKLCNQTVFRFSKLKYKLCLQFENRENLKLNVFQINGLKVFFK